MLTVKACEKLQEQFQDNLSAASLSRLADGLGLSPDSLRQLGLGFATRRYSFPERDPAGIITGFLLRDAKTHERRMRPGSVRGLTIPDGVTAANVQLVCEGVSDTAAALTLGYAAIGLPSAGVCIPAAVAFLKQARQSMYPALVGDGDATGLAGMKHLADALLAEGIVCRTLSPAPHADLRAWLQAGLTSCELREQVYKCEFRYPPETRGGFQMIPNRLIDAGLLPLIGGHGIRVLLVIMSRQRRGGTTVNISREEIGRLTGLKRSQIDAAKRQLRRHGFLSWRRGYKVGDGKGVANGYTVNLGPIPGAAKYRPPVEPHFGYLVGSKPEGQKGATLNE